jgi:hypothetical protein
MTQDPGFGLEKFGSGINIPYYISENLVAVLGFKYLHYLLRIRIRDPVLF